MARPLALDLFCGPGGMAAGLHRAGFDVVGVDLHPQPSYPFAFTQMDAVRFLDRVLETGKAPWAYVHASPPCPRYSVLSRSWNVDGESHPDLIKPVRERLISLGLPFSIENVVGAPLATDSLKLCGSMFDLPVERHRLFECHGFRPAAMRCAHKRQRELWPDGFPALRSDRGPEKRARVVGIYGTGGGPTKDLALWKWAMDVPWMRTKREVSDAIPPAYGEYVGAAALMSGI
jgi:DNA (cytosine-5)-methyltransferase 1